MNELTQFHQGVRANFSDFCGISCSPEFCFKFESLQNSEYRVIFNQENMSLFFIKLLFQRFR